MVAAASSPLPDSATQPSMLARDDKEGEGDLDGQTREDEGWWDGMDLLGKVRGQSQRGSSRCSRRSSRGRLIGEHKFEAEADRSVMQQTAASADG